jgi:iron complex transport system ATP-binding protein
MMQTLGLGLQVSGHVLVDALDWQILPGQCWCVIGRNGAGKSTLLDTLAGLRQPDRGVLQVRGRALANWPLRALALERAYLPQGRNDAFSYSVIDTVLSARHPYHDARYWESDNDHHIAQDALSQLDVVHLAERDVRSLSGGERQRVAIAAVLAQDTPLLLLDEPANALDLAHQVSVMHLLKSLCREAGKAIVMVSHDLNQVQAVASHALLLMGGGRWQAGSVGEVMTAALLGSCLGHPIDIVRHGVRTFYLPAEQCDERSTTGLR